MVRQRYTDAHTARRRRIARLFVALRRAVRSRATILTTRDSVAAAARNVADAFDRWLDSVLARRRQPEDLTEELIVAVHKFLNTYHGQ
jgi:hypothetical protein